MLVRLIAGMLSLLAFSVAIIAGLNAGNPATTILFRAWLALILYLFVGFIIGWIVQVVYEEFKNQQNGSGNVASKNEVKPENSA